MGNVFRKAKASKITKQDKAVLQLKQQRDKLRQYQKRVETSMENDRQLAKSLIAGGKKSRALLLLRKKRYQETLLQNADRQLLQLEQLASDLEFAQVEIEVVNGLRAGNQALKDINATMDVEDIAQMLEETQEGIEKQKEINALLNGVLTDEDEDAVLEELDKLVKEEVDQLPVMAASGDVEAEELEGAEKGIKDEGLVELPDVPKEKIKVREARELAPALES